VKKAVLFDLGNTLVQYYERAEFPALLQEGIARVAERLRADGLLRVDSDTVRRRVAAENHEAADHKVRPMEERLGRIFEVHDVVAEGLCAGFMDPIFRIARVYEETVPVLETLRARGITTGLVSNTPWGSPALLWREELRRLGLYSRIDHAVFCRDVGWRKPDKRIFDFALERVGVAASDCLYVGDNPRWDRAGPATVGMGSVLVERGDYAPDGGPSIRQLRDLLRRV
jgi:putative hydrolase of the HAD superfamily